MYARSQPLHLCVLCGPESSNIAIAKVLFSSSSAIFFLNFLKAALCRFKWNEWNLNILNLDNAQKNFETEDLRIM
jgi:hypothetical protein